jgi:hypothetical protein
LLLPLPTLIAGDDRDGCWTPVLLVPPEAALCRLRILPSCFRWLLRRTAAGEDIYHDPCVVRDYRLTDHLRIVPVVMMMMRQMISLMLMLTAKTKDGDADPPPKSMWPCSDGFVSRMPRDAAIDSRPACESHVIAIFIDGFKL